MAFGELRKPRQHAPVAVDRGGDAGVGRGEVHPTGLDGAQPRDLKVLRRRERIAEPGYVRHVDEDRRVPRAARDLVAERVLVADVDRDALAGGTDGALIVPAPREVGERDLQHAEDPAEARRNELAERDEGRLVVGLRRGAAKGNDAVEVFVASCAVRHAEQQVAAVAFGDAFKALEEVGFDAVEEARDGRFRKYDRFAAGVFAKGTEGARVAAV